LERFLIAGLGNPGREYAGNRHNVGFRCVERFAAVHGLSFSKRQKKARVALGTVDDHPLVLARPRTFMNKSGQAVAPLVRFYKIPLERVLLIYDDLDLPLGTTRLRPSGGSGGHRGVRSVIQQLGSQAFARLRIGIGRPPGRMDPADYVLQDFSAEEEVLLDEVLEHAVDAIEAWLDQGIEAAMSRYNSSVIEQ
jgi:PTH1 family peptidyl-tRNA hydrolase